MEEGKRGPEDALGREKVERNKPVRSIQAWSDVWKSRAFIYSETGRLAAAYAFDF